MANDRDAGIGISPQTRAIRLGGGVPGEELRKSDIVFASNSSTVIPLDHEIEGITVVNHPIQDWGWGGDAIAWLGRRHGRCRGHSQGTRRPYGRGYDYRW